MNYIHTDDELKEIAKKVVNNEIFVSFGGKSLIAFQMIIALSDSESIKDTCAMYEYYDKCGPGSINGYPTFFSAHLLNKDSAERLLKYIKKIEILMNNI